MNKKPCIAIIMSLAMIASTGCTSTKINADLTKPATIEEIVASEYIDLNIPENLMDTINKTNDDLQATDEETITAINEKYLYDKMEPEKITDKTIEEGDILNLTYVCYKDGMFVSDYSKTGLPISVTVEKESTEHPEGLLEFLIGKKSSGEYEYVSTIGDEKKGEVVMDVTFTITVNYAEGEYIYPDAETYFNDNVYLQADYNNYKTFFKSEQVAKTVQKKEQAFYDILKEIANNSEFKKDHSLLTRAQYKSLLYNHEAIAASYGLTMEAYRPTIGFEDQESFESKLWEDAEILTQEKLVYFAILEEKGLSLEGIDYNNTIRTMSINWGFDSVNECITIYGSDILRFECIRREYQDIILAYGIKGYSEQYIEDLNGSAIATEPINIQPTEEESTKQSEAIVVEKRGE